MTLRLQRLIVIIFSLALITFAIILIMINSKKNIVFFYTPSEFLELENVNKEKIRIGGLVKKKFSKKKLW